jgi:hypothetical protein
MVVTKTIWIYQVSSMIFYNALDLDELDRYGKMNQRYG